jgi:hypothetical protein
LIIRRRRGHPAPASSPIARLTIMGKLLCRRCLEGDGAESTSVVEHRCTDERTGKHFTANVCARCLEAGRETRVTCRTFTPSNHGYQRSQCHVAL